MRWYRVWKNYTTCQRRDKIRKIESLWKEKVV